MKITVLSGYTQSLVWFRTDMMREFIALGNSVTAVGEGSESEWGEIFARDGINYKSIPVKRNGTNPFADIRLFFNILNLLKSERPDKIFAYQAKTVIYGGIAAKLLGIDFYPLIAGTGSVYLDGGIKNRILRVLLTVQYKLSMNKSKHIFFHNSDDLEFFIKKGIVKTKNVTVLNGSGVNVEHFSEQPMPLSPSFVCISRLIKDKGVEDYLNACRILKQKMPDVKCMLVGPFDTNPSAITKEELDLFLREGCVEYYGAQKDVRPYLAQSTVFVLPSRHEGRPKTILEAMATGRAILTTDAPGCRETVNAGKNGILVPVGDVNALAGAMEKLAGNPALVAEMAAEARRIAVEQYDVKKVNAVIIEKMGLN